MADNGIKITSTQADRFSQVLRELEREVAESSGIHPLLLKARKEALQSQLADLEDDLREYEALKAGDLEKSVES